MCVFVSKITFVILNFIGCDALTVFFLTALTGGDATTPTAAATPSTVIGATSIGDVAAVMGTIRFSSSFVLFSSNLSNSLTPISASSVFGGSAFARNF